MVKEIAESIQKVRLSMLVWPVLASLLGGGGSSVYLALGFVHNGGSVLES